MTKNSGGTLGLAVQHLEQSLGDMWLVAELMNRDGDTVSTAKRAEYLSFISTTAAELSHLVSDFVQMNSLEARSATLSCTPLQVSELVLQCMEGLHSFADSRAVEVGLLSSGSEAHVQADYWKLSQAIHALLEDSIRSTSPGGRVDVEVRTIPKAVRIVIRSSETMRSGNRVGISSFSASGSPKGETCLSVPIAKEIIDLHGGLISGVSGGKQFVVVLPAAA